MASPDFLQELSARIREEQPFSREEKLLCAVSGGLDSMVLAESLHSLGYPLEIAHVNFELRGEDSFLDETFVQQWAEEKAVVFHLKRAGKELDHLQGSLQERARNLRYEWLEKLAAERGISHLLLGHHADDQLETILLQFFRGSGTAGLQGMKASSGIRRRPLLSFPKESLRTYALAAGLKWREDLSNTGEAYLRNRIRHRLVPVLKEIFPGIDTVINRNAQRASHAASAVDHLFQSLFLEFLKEERNDRHEFDLGRMNAHPMGDFFLSELLLRNGFTVSDAADLSLSETGSVKSLIRSGESRSRKNAGGLLAELRFPRLLLWKKGFNETRFTAIVLEQGADYECTLPDGNKLRMQQAGPSNEKNGPESADFAVAQNSFPLCLRLWQPGDRMAPEGMKGKKKKLSDIFSEAKLSAAEKSMQIVLTDKQGSILWIPGLRKAALVSAENASAFFFLISNS